MKPSYGKRVKDVASVVSGLIGLSAAILAIILLLAGKTIAIFQALVVLLAGALATWIIDVLLSGFGELVCNSEKLVNNSELLLKYIEENDDSKEKDFDN